MFARNSNKQNMESSCIIFIYIENNNEIVLMITFRLKGLRTFYILENPTFQIKLSSFSSFNSMEKWNNNKPIGLSMILFMYLEQNIPKIVLKVTRNWFWIKIIPILIRRAFILIDENIWIPSLWVFGLNILEHKVTEFFHNSICMFFTVFIIW